jgi:competence protein ComEC
MPHALANQVLAPALPLPASGRTGFRINVWQAPLVPMALALTAGIVLDRHYAVPAVVSLLAAATALAAWLIARSGRRAGLPLVYLALAVAALGACYHRARQEVFAPDDIGREVAEDPQPVRVQGVLDEEPQRIAPVDDPLLSIPRKESTEAVLRVTARRQGQEWKSASGLASLIVGGRLEGFHSGDQVEVVGRLVAPRQAANPGEADAQAFLLDQRIRAQVIVRNTPQAVTRLADAPSWSLTGWLAGVRGWAGRRLDEALPPETAGVARALLLGEDRAMARPEWDRYIRSGVVHVLAISGLHLVVLAGFLWAVLRLMAVPRRRGAWLVAAVIVLYALLTGGRPPVLRATVTVVACCVGLYLRRPALSANTLALAWIVVALCNPANVFHIGCQLSFLAVAVLYWGCGRWFSRTPDPLELLIEESRPPWERRLRRFGRKLALTYAVTAVVWLAQAPLVAAHYHLVSPLALLIGPPAVVLASAALVTGCLALTAAAACPPLASAFMTPLALCLRAGAWLVGLADRWPVGHWYVADIPAWWLWAFYVALLALLLLEPLLRQWRWAIVAGLAWCCVGLGSAWARPGGGELRCTFLAVGHGGCTVLETPDGRVLVYDAGALGGPEVTRRQIAPFLWHRGIRRIDEVLLSHALLT